MKNISKWEIISYSAFVVGMCLAIYAHFTILSKIAVVTIENSRPLAKNAQVICNITSESNKVATVSNLIGINGYYSGWIALPHLWIPILSVVLVISSFCSPVAWYWWRRGNKKLERELRNVMDLEIQTIQSTYAENHLREQLKLQKQYEQNFWEHPEIVKLNAIYAGANAQVTAMCAELDDNKTQITKLEKHLAKAEGQLIRHKKRQDND